MNKISLNVFFNHSPKKVAFVFPFFDKDVAENQSWFSSFDLCFIHI